MGTSKEFKKAFKENNLEEYFLGKDPRKTTYYKKYAGKK
jgi:hypothetical protein